MIYCAHGLSYNPVCFSLCSFQNPYRRKFIIILGQAETPLPHTKLTLLLQLLSLLNDESSTALLFLFTSVYTVFYFHLNFPCADSPEHNINEWKGQRNINKQLRLVSNVW